jgi:glyoxylase-like metal-dependent hydrolase (beta-lactamase superfamily II)/predicted dienelactone hydrolase
MTLNDLTTVLLVGAFLLLALLKTPRWRTWSGALLILASIAAAVRLARGHEPWQMTPALLVLAASVIATGLMYLTTWRRWVATHRKTRVTAALALLAALLLTPAAYWMSPMFELPHPSGAFAIGTTEFHLVDESRPEVHTANPLDRRELMVKVWYPAEPAACKRFAPYLEHAAAIARAVNRDNWPLGTPLSHLDQIPTHACAGAPAAAAQPTYPVLIFSHGLTMGYAAQNTVLMEELASRGYVIFSIDHPYQGLAAVFPNGRVATFSSDAWSGPSDPQTDSAEYLRAQAEAKKSLDPAAQRRFQEISLHERPFEAGRRRFWYEYWSEDQRFVLDQLGRIHSGAEPTPLKGRLDLAHVGLFGMSFGGATSAWTCAHDERCKAGINLDGFGNALVELPPHRQPFMSINSEGQTANALFLAKDLGYRYYAQIKGAVHLDFTDSALISPIVKVALEHAPSGRIDTSRMQEVTNAYVTAFFDCHLRARSCELIEGPSSKYPEVTLIARPPVQPQDEQASAAPCAPFPATWIDGIRTDEPPVQVQRYDADTFVLRQSVRTNFEAPFLYLLFGQEAALLLDTGAGGIQLRPVIDRLMSDWQRQHGGRRLRLIVAHSHGHGDHRGGDAEFVDRKDTVVVGLAATDVARFFGVARWPEGSGQLNLGDRILDVIPTPGHEPAHIMIYDRRTGFLLSGDALYPGRLYVPASHFDEERASVERLAAFARSHPVSCVLGAHIEMTNQAGVDFPDRAPEHPNEHVLQLAPGAIAELRDVVRDTPPQLAKQRRADFILVPLPGR